MSRPLTIIALLIFGFSLFLESCYALLVFIPIGGAVAIAVLSLVCLWIVLLLSFKKISISRILIAGFVAKLTLIITLPSAPRLLHYAQLNNIFIFALLQLILFVAFETPLIWLFFKNKRESFKKILISVVIANAVLMLVMSIQQYGGCKYFTMFYSKSQQAYFEQRRAEYEGRALPEGAVASSRIEPYSEGKIKRTTLRRTPEGILETTVEIQDVE